MSQFLQQLIEGLQLGSLYALIAVGYTVVYGIVQLINFAHGEVFMIGAFGALATWTLLFKSTTSVWVLPVMIVGAAAGRMTRKALRKGPTSSVRATFSHSRRTVATPKAVLMSIGHTEQMKITKIADRLESLMV